MPIFKKILLILKGVLILMSKFAQCFSRYRPVYKLDEKTNVLELTEDKVDIQEEVNSYYDESLYHRLESYFESTATRVQICEEIADDYDGYGNDADQILDIMQSVSDLRSRYNLSEDLYSITDVLNFVRAKASAQPTPAPKPTEPTEPEGGDSDAQQNPDSES